MKKQISLLLALLMLFSLAFSMPFVGGAEDEWTCPECATVNTGNFCSNCGEKKPVAETLASGETGEFKLFLKIDFEENLFFSTYDVDVYLNDKMIGEMPHGKSFEKTLSVSAGNYTIRFYEQGDKSVKGEALFAVASDTKFSCEIHAKNDEIKIDGIQTNGGEVDTRAAAGKPNSINGIEATLLSVKESKGSSYSKPDAGNVYVLCEFEISNDSSSELAISSLLSFEAYCDGYKYDSSFGAIMEVSNQLDGSIDPGRKMKGGIGFEVPKNWKELEVIFKPDFWSNEKLTFITRNN